MTPARSLPPPSLPPSLALFLSQISSELLLDSLLPDDFLPDGDLLPVPALASHLLPTRLLPLSPPATMVGFGGGGEVGLLLLPPLLDLLLRVPTSSPSHLPKLWWLYKEKGLGEEGRPGGGEAAGDLGALAIVEAVGQVGAGAPWPWRR
jgi:hypothetical protein